MKKTSLLFLMLALVTTSIHAQESAFEVHLTDYSNLNGVSFCRETQEGQYIVVLGTNKIVKLSQQGEVIREMTYLVDSLDETWDRFGALLDLPNDPLHHIAIAEAYDPYKEVGNILHVITFDDNLDYNPSDVVVIDLSEEVKFIDESCWPRYIIDNNGDLVFAANVMKWDGTTNLLFVRVSPEGEKTIHFDHRYCGYIVFNVCDFIPKNGHYDMVLGFNNGRDSLAFVTVGSDFGLDIINTFRCGSSDLTPLQYDNHVDSLCVAAWLFESTCAPTGLDNDTFLLPTTIMGWNHHSTSWWCGAGIWKLSSDFDILDFALFDVYDTDPKKKFKLLNTPYPVLVNGDDVYFCYTTYPGSASGPFQTAICKLDINLNTIWKRWYGGDSAFHYVTDFVLTSDGGCLLSGNGHPQASHYYDPYPYVLKITSDGYCSVKENEELLLKPYCFFPNPVDDRLHLEFSPDVTPSVVELYDFQGRLVGTQNTSLENVDMNGLPAGTYTLRIVMEDGTVYSDKVVKNQ